MATEENKSRTFLKWIHGFEGQVDCYYRRLFLDKPWHDTFFLIFTLYACGVLANYAAHAFNGGLVNTYDTLWYHLPTALRYVHLLSFEYSPDSPYLLKGISNPPLAHLVQGLLIKLTGTVSAAQWPGVFILLAYLVTLKKVYGQGICLSAAIIFIASVPLILAHLSISSIDLWTNTLCAFAILAADRLFHKPAPRWVALSCATILATIYSKMTLWPTVAALGVISTIVIFVQCRKKHLAWKNLFLYIIIGGGLAPLWSLYLWHVYSNAFFPYPNPFNPAAPSLPINPSYTASKTHACWDSLNINPALQSWSNFRQFFWSFFELTRLMTTDKMNWVMGQFDVGSIHHRMGGFNGVTMAVGSIVTSAGAYLDKNLRFVAVLLLGLTLLTAFTPGSHELRYFMYIPLCMALIVARTAALQTRFTVFAKNILLPLAFISPLFLAGKLYLSPYMAVTVPPVYTKYWKGLDAYIAKHGVPDRPFCRPDIGPEKTEETCKIIPSLLYSRALAAGLDMNTYKVAEWCVSDTPKLAPPLPPAQSKAAQNKGQQTKVDAKHNRSRQ